MCGYDLTFQSQKMIDVMYGDVWSKFSALFPLQFIPPHSNNSSSISSRTTTTTTKKLFSYLMFFDEHLMAIHFRFPYNMQIPLVYFKLCAATQHKMLCTFLAWVKIIFFATYPTCTSCLFQFIAAVFFWLSWTMLRLFREIFHISRNEKVFFSLFIFFS